MLSMRHMDLILYNPQPELFDKEKEQKTLENGVVPYLDLPGTADPMSIKEGELVDAEFTPQPEEGEQP